jgi:hypothetical protein
VRTTKSKSAAVNRSRQLAFIIGAVARASLVPGPEAGLTAGGVFIKCPFFTQLPLARGGFS